MGQTQLQCRHDPPVVHPLPQNGKIMLVSMWPTTEEGSWCGKHELDPMMQERRQ